MSTQEITKSFKVEPDQSSAFIAEAFGIEAGYTKEVLDLTLPDTLHGVTYITGESGSGKTTLLKQLGWEEDYSLPIPDGALYSWADSEEEAIKLLSMVGLGDALLFVSKYGELSDSQQHRAELYLHLLNGTDPLLIDEFLATLDRESAKAVSFVFQKICRKLDRDIVVATSHTDLIEYLQPDLLVEGKAFPSRWSIEVSPVAATNPFVPNLTYTEKDKEWYRDCSLGELHYKGKYTGGVKDYLAARYEGKLVGFLIATYRMHDGGRRISRLVTHPSYRGCGIGQAITKRYLEEEPGADVVASMARFNPVFAKAGMKRVEDSEQKPPTGLKTDLKQFDFDRDNWYSKDYCVEFMQDPECREMMAEYASTVNYLVTPGGESLTDDEVAERIESKAQTAGRILWNIRPKTMAKFVGPAYPSD